MTNNLNASLTKNSIDFDPNTKSTLDLNEQTSNSIVIEQKQIQLDVNNLITNDSNHEQKSAYKIPSPKMLLPTELSSSSKSITSSSSMIINKISRLTSSDNHRNLLIFNQPNSFYLKHPEEFIPTSEKFSTTNFNLIQTISSQKIQTSDHTNLSQMTNEILSSSVLPISQDIKLLRDNETIPNVSPLEISPQIKTRSEIKHESESLWKTKFTLKTLLSMSNRDEAQALKNRKPIDYHMFLSNKWKKNSSLQYHDHIERKFTTNNKHSIIEQVNEGENRKLYKRLLNTMDIGKPRKIESMTSMKSRKTKRKTRIKSSAIIREDSLPSLIDEPEKLILITYEAKPISLLNK